MTDANTVIDAVLDAVEAFDPKDTTVIQVRSVLNFMYALGYTLDEDSKTGRFITKQKGAQGNRFVGFNTAARLHNSTLGEWQVDEVSGLAYPSGVTFQTGFTPLGVHLAFASKLVLEVKLGVTRHGQVKVQDVMIHPMNNHVLRLVEQEA